MEPVSSLSFIELVGRVAALGEFTFIPFEINTYTDHVDIEFHIVQNSDDGDSFTETETVTVPLFENDRFLPLFMRGYSFVWDRVDMMFRWIPEKLAEESVDISAYIKYFDNGELRIHREYAEQNLSPAALRYSFESSEEYIAWNTRDYSHIPIIFEMPAAFDYMKDYEGEHPLKPDELNVYGKLQFFCTGYCQECGVVNENLGAMLAQNYAKKLWTPDDPALKADGIIGIAGEYRA